MMRSYLFSILLAFFGLAISFLSRLVKDKWLKIFFIICAAMVVLIAALWFGYEKGIRENKDNSDKIASLEKEIKSREKDRSGLLANLRIKEEENKKLREKMDERSEELQVGKIELSKSNEHINNLKNKIKSNNDEIVSLKKQIANMQQQLLKPKAGREQVKAEPPSEDNFSNLLVEVKKKPFYENNILNIEVVSFKEFGPYFNLALKHTNKAKQPIIMRAFEHSVDTFLIDDRNNQFNYIAPYNVGRGEELALSDRGSTIELVPGSPKVISFQFACPNKSYGKIFAFSSKYGYCINQGFAPLPHNPIYVSIKGIKLE